MKLATHNGIFQADDVFAYAILKRVFPQHELVRTRDEAILADADLVFDVGGIYDHEKRLYDHHQRDRAGTRDNGILYSSAGLIWKHYGLALVNEDERIHELVDRFLFQPVDALDNGQDLFAGEAVFKGVFGDGMSVTSVISGFNPNWYEDNKDFDGAFIRASLMASIILSNTIASAKGYVLADGIVEKALSERTDPRLVVLAKFCPWQKAVVSDPDAQLVVFESETGEWMLQCVPPALGSFDKRLPLPESWAGLRGEELSKHIDLPGSIFCHAGRFVAGHATREGAIKMANMVLDGAK